MIKFQILAVVASDQHVWGSFEPKRYWLKYMSQDLYSSIKHFILNFMGEFDSSPASLHAACSWLFSFQQLVIFGPQLDKKILLGLRLIEEDCLAVAISSNSYH